MDMDLVEPPPVFIGYADKSGLRIFLEGRNFSSARLSTFMSSDGARFKDINGKDIGSVLDRVGWNFAAAPYLVSAYEEDSDTPIAFGAAARISWMRDRAPGVNLSYAVAQTHTKQGLAKILTSMSFQLLVADMAEQGRSLESLGDINIQCDEHNKGSIAVAKSMGFDPKESSNFLVPKIGLNYLGFTSPVERFFDYTKALVSELATDTPPKATIYRQRHA